MTWKDRIERLSLSRQEQKLWRTRTKTESPQSRQITVDGCELLNFCGNDYLGLANHPELAQASISAIEKWGCGSGASHLICGHSELHEQLESALADFVSAESALLFSTGYMANLSLPQTFLDRHGLLLEDKLNHASLLDAGQFCAATMKRYPHLDHSSAERFLSESVAEQKMLMTDGVFSMDGDLAPAVELDAICKRHDAILVVDDAHGLGVLGDQGGGCLQLANVPINGNVLLMGTLGKAAGSFGAFVAGDSRMIESLIQFSRPYIYTTALPPAIAASSLAAIGIMKRDAWRREKLQANVEYFRQSAESSGMKLGSSTTPIQPIMIGSAVNAIHASELLLQAGIWVVAIRPPTVPHGTARLRVTLTAEHSREDIDRLLQALTSLELISPETVA